MTKYTKNPVTIEAFQLDKNYDPEKCAVFEWFEKALLEGDVSRNEDGTVSINTLEGVMRANIGDYIIQGIKGEIYACKPDIFEATYTEKGLLYYSSLSFGAAIEAMKQGKRAARKGWNGKGMFVYYVPAASYPAQRNTKNTMVGMFPNDMVPYREYLALKTADGDVATWAPSTSDALAEDWIIVE